MVELWCFLKETLNSTPVARLFLCVLMGNCPVFVVWLGGQRIVWPFYWIFEHRGILVTVTYVMHPCSIIVLLRDWFCSFAVLQFCYVRTSNGRHQILAKIQIHRQSLRVMYNLPVPMLWCGCCGSKFLLDLATNLSTHVACFWFINRYKESLNYGWLHQKTGEWWSKLADHLY
jgi:hypothetical protein